MIDAVYMVKDGGSYEELRYSMRSIANIGDLGRVWILGGRPDWLLESDQVHHVFIEQDEDKYLNTRKMFFHAVRNEDISDPFYLMNDDFFITAPMPTIPVYSVGKYAERVRSRFRRNVVGSYTDGMVNTIKLLRQLGYDDPLSYEAHMPMPLGKEGLLVALGAGRNIPYVQTRSVYGNMYCPDPVMVKDCKMIHPHRKVFDPDPPIVSTSDDSFRVGAIGYQIRHWFPEPGFFERTV